MNKSSSKIAQKLLLQQPKADERKIWDIINVGCVGYSTFLVAHELRLFSLLADQPQTLAEICETLQIKRRAAEALVSMNVSLGLLHINNGAYTLTQLAKDYLLENSPTYIGGFLDLHIANIQVFSFDSIKQAVLTKQRAKMLAWYMPAGIERFFAEIGVEVDSPDAPSVPATPAAIERVLAAAPKYGIEFRT